MKKSIFVCGGFINEQYLWLIPIICAYAKKLKINKIIFEKKIKIEKLPNYIRILLDNYNVTFINKENNLQKKFFFIYYLLKNINIFLYVFFNLKKKKLLSKKVNWTKLQFLHGAWDQINLKENDSTNKLILRLKVILQGIYEIEFGKRMINSGVTHFFLSHTVYSKRWLLAYLRKKNVEIFNQSFLTIHKQNKNEDRHWADIEKKLLNTYKNKKKLIENYWQKRKNGKGRYSASNYSILNSKNKVDLSKFKNYNLILLHIFRDSPFYCIDKNRIFVDYFDWFKSTLKIFEKSNENVLIKLHPIHKRWGEDQPKIVNEILNQLFGQKKLPRNFKVINFCPKNELFLNAKRILTFSGTSAVEAIAYSKKPIVISKSSIENFNKELVYRPTTISMYKHLLLVENNFTNNITNSYLAKCILFIRENVLSLRKILNCDDIYRNDSRIKVMKNYKIVYKNSIKYKKELYNQGTILANYKLSTKLNN